MNNPKDYLVDTLECLSKELIQAAEALKEDTLEGYLRYFQAGHVRLSWDLGQPSGNVHIPTEIANLLYVKQSFVVERFIELFQPVIDGTGFTIYHDQSKFHGVFGLMLKDHLSDTKPLGGFVAPIDMSVSTLPLFAKDMWGEETYNRVVEATHPLMEKLSPLGFHLD